jgi:hypothetical protein
VFGPGVDRGGREVKHGGIEPDRDDVVRHRAAHAPESDRGDSVIAHSAAAWCFAIEVSDTR